MAELEKFNYGFPINYWADRRGIEEWCRSKFGPGGCGRGDDPGTWGYQWIAPDTEVTFYFKNKDSAMWFLLVHGG